MADLLASIRAEIDVRLGELRPAIAEYEELLSVLDALGSDGRSVSGQSASGAGSRAVAQSRTAAPQRSGASARARSPRPKARPAAARRARKRERPVHSPTGQAILAALEHGSHTLAELVTVTALSASDIRESLRRLRKHGAIVKADRDGKAAYALPAPA
jgi:DNA-binding transcriptional ArsR family regulator